MIVSFKLNGSVINGLHKHDIDQNRNGNWVVDHDYTCRLNSHKLLGWIDVAECVVRKLEQFRLNQYATSGIVLILWDIKRYILYQWTETCFSDVSKTSMQRVA